MHARADQLFHELAGENPDDFHVDIISQGDNGPAAETVATAHTVNDMHRILL